MMIDEKTMVEMFSSAKRILLIEPKYRRKYPPLGLMKIARFLEGKKKYWEYQTWGNPNPPDLICVTSLFTFELSAVNQSITDAALFYPGVPVIAGGPCVSLLPNLIDSTYVFQGYSRFFDGMIPAYNYDWKTEEPWNEFSFTFTSRGCPNSCPYCAVPKIEKEVWINPEWKDHIVDSKPYAMISDNNLSATGGHIFDVIRHLAEKEKKVVFDNGFDCKHITPRMATELAKLRYTRAGLRLAFDRIEEDGVFQKAVETLKAAGVAKGNIMAYCLFNFTDTPEEADYRMRECVKLGIRPYPQQFEPLNIVNRDKRYIGKHWNADLLRKFRFFWLMAGKYTKMTFSQYLEKEKAKCG